jgi:hypothetical protein
LLGVAFIAAVVLFNRLGLGKDMNQLELEVISAIRIPLVIFALVLFGVAAWLFKSWQQRDTRESIRRIGASYVLVYIVILGLVMPQLEPTKTYAPQGKWIRDQIGPDATHIGMVYPNGRGISKRGAFGFETGGVMVDLLESPAEVDQFFGTYPESLILVEQGSANLVFAGDEEKWHDRVQRDLWVGTTLYYVLRRPTDVRAD